MMLQQMMTWIIEAPNNARGSKYFVISVEALDGSVNGLNGLCVMDIMANKTTEFYEIIYSMNNLSRDVAPNGRWVHLHEGL